MLVLRLLIPFMHRSAKIYALHALSKFLFVKNYRRLAVILENFISFRYGCFISPEADISKHWVLPHPVGVVIGAGVVIEDRVVIYQGVTIGRKSMYSRSSPVLLKDSIIYANSVIVGDVRVGPNAKIGALSFVNRDVSESETYIRS